MNPLRPSVVPLYMVSFLAPSERTALFYFGFVVKLVAGAYAQRGGGGGGRGEMIVHNGRRAVATNSTGNHVMFPPDMTFIAHRP